MVPLPGLVVNGVGWHFSKFKAMHSAVIGSAMLQGVQVVNSLGKIFILKALPCELAANTGTLETTA